MHLQHVRPLRQRCKPTSTFLLSNHASALWSRPRKPHGWHYTTSSATVHPAQSADNTKSWSSVSGILAVSRPQHVSFEELIRALPIFGNREGAGQESTSLDSLVLLVTKSLAKFLVDDGSFIRDAVSRLWSEPTELPKNGSLVTVFVAVVDGLANPLPEEEMRKATDSVKLPLNVDQETEGLAYFATRGIPMFVPPGWTLTHDPPHLIQLRDEDGNDRPTPSSATTRNASGGPELQATLSFHLFNACSGASSMTQTPESTLGFQLPMANTIFHTGKSSTVHVSHWHILPDSVDLIWEKNYERGNFDIYLPLSTPIDDLVVDHDAPLLSQNKVLQIPLLGLTEPRHITACRGNVITRLASDGEETGIPASQELEQAVAGRLKDMGTAFTAWALIVPKALAAEYPIKPSSEFKRRGKLLMSSYGLEVDFRRRRSEATIMFYLWQGAKLCRVQSGGGGWGSKAGLLSLDADTAHAKSTQDDKLGPNMPLDFSSMFTNVASPGDSISFYYTTDLVPILERSLDMRNATISSISFGVASDTSLSDSVPGYDAYEENVTSGAKIAHFQSHFGILSAGGMGFERRLANGEMHRSKIDTLRASFTIEEQMQGTSTESLPSSQMVDQARQASDSSCEAALGVLSARSLAHESVATADLSAAATACDMYVEKVEHNLNINFKWLLMLARSLQSLRHAPHGQNLMDFVVERYVPFSVSCVVRSLEHIRNHYKPRGITQIQARSSLIAMGLARRRTKARRRLSAHCREVQCRRLGSRGSVRRLLSHDRRKLNPKIYKTSGKPTDPLPVRRVLLKDTSVAHKASSQAPDTRQDAQDPLPVRRVRLKDTSVAQKASSQAPGTRQDAQYRLRRQGRRSRGLKISYFNVGPAQGPVNQTTGRDSSQELFAMIKHLVGDPSRRLLESQTSIARRKGKLILPRYRRARRSFSRIRKASVLRGRSPRKVYIQSFRISKAYHSKLPRPRKLYSKLPLRRIHTRKRTLQPRSRRFKKHVAKMLRIRKTVKPHEIRSVAPGLAKAVPSILSRALRYRAPEEGNRAKLKNRQWLHLPEVKTPVATITKVDYHLVHRVATQGFVRKLLIDRGTWAKKYNEVDRGRVYAKLLAWQRSVMSIGQQTMPEEDLVDPHTMSVARARLHKRLKFEKSMARRLYKIRTSLGHDDSWKEDDMSSLLDFSTSDEGVRDGSPKQRDRWLEVKGIIDSIASFDYWAQNEEEQIDGQKGAERAAAENESMKDEIAELERELQEKNQESWSSDVGNDEEEELGSWVDDLERDTAKYQESSDMQFNLGVAANDEDDDEEDDLTLDGWERHVERRAAKRMSEPRRVKTGKYASWQDEARRSILSDDPESRPENPSHSSPPESSQTPLAPVINAAAPSSKVTTLTWDNLDFIADDLYSRTKGTKNPKSSTKAPKIQPPKQKIKSKGESKMGAATVVSASPDGKVSVLDWDSLDGISAGPKEIKRGR